MSKFLKFFNLFSQSPSFRINGQIRPFSIFGSIIGMITISILIAAISFILNNYFSRFNYTINSYTDNLATPDIDLKDFKLAFLLTDLMGKPFPDHERLYKISARHWDIYLPKPGENRTQSISFVPIPIIKCDQYKENSPLKENFDLYSTMYNQTCLDFDTNKKNLTGIDGNTGG